MPEPTVTPWVSPDPPSEAALQRIFRGEGLLARWWSNGVGYRYEVHSHPYHKVLYCVRGSICFETDGMAFDLRPGDRLDIPPGTAHSALVGGEGVTCVEAPRKDGR